MEELREQLGWYCADVSTTMAFGTCVDQSILNSFCEGAKGDSHWGRHNGKNQYGHQSLFDRTRQCPLADVVAYEAFSIQIKLCYCYSPSHKSQRLRT